MGKVDEGGWESSFGLVSADHCGDPVRTLALVFVLILAPVLVPYVYFMYSVPILVLYSVQVLVF